MASIFDCAIKCTVLSLLFVFIAFGLTETMAADNSENFKRTVSNARLNTIFHSTVARSRISCGNTCALYADCESFNYKTTTGSCQYSTILSADVMADMVSASGWNVYSRRRNESEWTLVFRGTPGAGIDVYTAWAFGTSVTTTDVTCQQLDVTSCQKHYRNPLVDSWNSLQKSKVKYSLYCNGEEKAYVIFNGAGSSITSWFAPERILASSWTDITYQSFIFFSIEGHSPSRRFFISRTYGGCGFDTGYTAAVTSWYFVCSWDSHFAYPQFMYADSPTYVMTGFSPNFKKADVMAIHIME